MIRKVLITLVVLVSTFCFAQPPELISFRGIAINSSGMLQANKTINIRINILDSGSAGVSIFSEVHTVDTDANGNYSFSIGSVNPSNFKNINWGTEDKFLKVELDIYRTGSYILSGTTQLMSTPYALYAKTAKSIDGTAPNAPVFTVNTLADLRNSDLHTQTNTVYVKGHSEVGDGGEGFFYYNKHLASLNFLEVYKDNDGTIIKPISIDESLNHRWIRNIDGPINVRYFGAKGFWDRTGEDGKGIQKAIKFASITDFLSSRTVYIPNGTYYVKKLTLKSGVKLIGESLEETIINSICDENPYLIDMADGVVRDIQIKNITFNVDTNDSNYNNSNKGCMHFEAKPSTTSVSGGLWSSIFKNIRIIRFKGHSIYFEGGGGGSNYLLPNQFITLENVTAERGKMLTQNESPFIESNSLRITGTCFQFSFTNCNFDGGPYIFNADQTPNRKVNGINVHIGPKRHQQNNDEVFFPADITFNTCGFGGGEYAFFIDGSENITIMNSWFENFERAILIKGDKDKCTGGYNEKCFNSKSINILNNKFLYSAGRFGYLPDNSGRVIIVENSQANIHNNYVIDPSTKEEVLFIEGINSLGINTSGNYFDSPNLGNSIGIVSNTKITSIKDNLNRPILGLDLFLNKSVSIISTGNIYRINSMVQGGEIIILRNNTAGNITFHTMNNGTDGKNIFLSGRSSLTLKYGDTATFLKIDGHYGKEKAIYQLTSTSGVVN
ncbi:MAG: hypothetical protein H6604_04395 [Flavobacteriales bacterium]|nr:hypothetical protein [Flavobacteriales bacterium]